MAIRDPHSNQILLLQTKYPAMPYHAKNSW